MKSDKQSRASIIWGFVKGVGWHIWVFCFCLVLGSWVKADVYNDLWIAVLPSLAAILIIMLAITAEGARQLSEETMRLVEDLTPTDS